MAVVLRCCVPPAYRIVKHIAVVLHPPLGQRDPAVRRRIRRPHQRTLLLLAHEILDQLQAGDAQRMGAERRQWASALRLDYLMEQHTHTYQALADTQRIKC
jgi:hypothetical protein